MIWEESSNSWELQQCQIRKWNNNSFIFRSINDTTISIEDVTPEIIKKDFVKPEEMDYWELSDFIHKLENKGLSTNRWLVNKYYKKAVTINDPDQLGGTMIKNFLELFDNKK